MTLVQCFTAFFMQRESLGAGLLMRTSGSCPSDSDSPGLVPDICFKPTLPDDSIVGGHTLRTLL